MNKHKEQCDILKAQRKKLADELGIDLNQSECTFDGNCLGTCPKCQEEERLLNEALLGKKEDKNNNVGTSFLGPKVMGKFVSNNDWFEKTPKIDDDILGEEFNDENLFMGEVSEDNTDKIDKMLNLIDKKIKELDEKEKNMKQNNNIPEGFKNVKLSGDVVINKDKK